MRDLKKDRLKRYITNIKKVYIALLTAQAAVISPIEGLIPNLLAFAAGSKIGLANIVTLDVILPYLIKIVSKLLTYDFF